MEDETTSHKFSETIKSTTLQGHVDIANDDRLEGMTGWEYWTVHGPYLLLARLMTRGLEPDILEDNSRALVAEINVPDGNTTKPVVPKLPLIFRR